MDALRRHGLRGLSVTLASLLFGLSPARVQAQTTCAEAFATATFYEVAETINCNPGGAADPVLDPFCLQQISRGFGTRIANARLEGSINGPPGFSGAATIQASSILSKVDWIGPAHGTISVDGSRAVFTGKLNLSVARMGVPLAPISGKWHGTKRLKAGGDFVGMFFIPFACPAESGLTGACYIRLDEEGNIAGFVQAEAPTGTPLVKLELTFCSR
jgi:hypothetical protein